MPSYVAYSNNGNGIAILAGSYEVRIADIRFGNEDVTSIAKMYRITSASMSGGTTIPVVAMRQGAPTASSTARTGVTPSGTSTMFEYMFLDAGQVSSPNGPYITTQVSGAPADFQPPLSLTLGSGDAFYTPNCSSTCVCAVYFEELLIPGTY